MTDIVDELREAHASGHAAGDVLSRAADVIDYLRDQLEQARASTRHYAGLALQRAHERGVAERGEPMADVIRKAKRWG